MKKIFTIFIILISFFSFSTQTNALLVEPNKEDLLVLRENLKKVKNGIRYISKIDSIIYRYKNNSKILNKLSLRIIKARTSLEYSTEQISTRQKNILTILGYLDLKVKSAIYKLYNK